MANRIDTQARIESVRFQNQTGSPAAPATGYSLLYITTNGLYMETSTGAIIGPFVTGTAAAPAGGRTLIAEALPTGTTATFSSIPGGHKKLVLEAAVRSTQAAAMVSANLQFNGDTTAGNYAYVDQYVYAAGTNGGDGSGAGNTFAINTISAANGPANSFSIFTMEIIQYANTNFNKQAITTIAHRRDNSSVYEMNMLSTVEWVNTAAITQLAVVLSAGNFAANSVLRLYYED